MRDYSAKIIETERLILRPISIEDVDDMFEYCSDEETVRYVSFQPHKSREETRDTLNNFFLNRKELLVPETHAIVLKSNSKMIGTCDFSRIKFGDTAEMGYIINKKYWNKGYVTEAANAILQWGVTDLKLRRIEIGHFSDNIGSQRVIEKLGFVYEGTKRQGFIKSKEVHDIKMYSLLKEELDERVSKQI